MAAFEIICGIVILFFISVLFKWFYNPNKGLWKKQGILEINTTPTMLAKGFYQVFTKPMHEIIKENYEKYGRVYGVFEFGTPSLNVADPEMLRKIFAKDFHVFHNRRSFRFNDEILDNLVSMLEGENWKRVRSVLSPTFSTGKIKKMSILVEECVETLITNLNSNLNETLNIKDLFGNYAMDVIARCAFAMKLDSHKDPNNPFITYAKSITKPTFSWKILPLLLLPKKLFEMLHLNLAPQKPFEFFSKITKELIAQRRSEKNQMNQDFLSLMLEASEKISETDKNSGISETEMIAQAVLFFLTGYDTIANTLSFAAYNLAINPDIQKELQKEIDSAVASDHTQFDNIMNLPYLEAFFSESMRTHGLLPRIERVAAQDYELNNIKIPKGTIIAVPTHALHFDEEFFPEPDVFKPERFMPENKDQIHPYTFLPFGAGPRNCVAMRFALMEIKMALFFLMQHFEFVATDETKAGIIYHRFVGLRQTLRIPIKVVKRA